jgi:hypothetical protein
LVSRKVRKDYEDGIAKIILIDINTVARALLKNCPLENLRALRVKKMVLSRSKTYPFRHFTHKCRASISGGIRSQWERM